MRKIQVFLLFLFAAALVSSASVQKKRKSGRGAVVVKSSNKKQENPVVVADDRLTIDQLKARLDAGAQLLMLDVRVPESWNSTPNKIKGAIRVPLEEIDRKKDEWKKDLEIIVYCDCQDESTSASVTRMLKRAGFKNVKALTGGWKAWGRAGFPVEPK